MAKPPASCQCAEPDRNRLIVAEKGQCLIVCGAEIEPKHVICRPCSLGNHTGVPCASYVRGAVWHLDRNCARCGFDSAMHQGEPE